MSDDDDTPVRKASKPRVKLLDGRANNGGARQGGGRKLGSHSRMSMVAREAAMRTGLLPHEILLSIARGEPVLIKTPRKARNGKWVTDEEMVGVTIEDVRDAAKAAAPYFAPKMSTVELIGGVSDDDLDELIKSAAAEAGISLADVGEGEEDADQAGEGSAAGGQRERAA